MEKLKPDATGIYVAAHQAPKAIEEAIAAEVPLIVAVAEHIPIHDILRVCSLSYFSFSTTNICARSTLFSRRNQSPDSWAPTAQASSQQSATAVSGFSLYRVSPLEESVS